MTDHQHIASLPRRHPTRREAQTATHRKIQRLDAAHMFDARLAKLYYSELSELPDGVRNYPTACQQAWMFTFNNWLRKSGDVPKSMFAANKALENVRRRIERKEREARKRRPRFDWDRLKPLRPQIVVP